MIAKLLTFGRRIWRTTLALAVVAAVLVLSASPALAADAAAAVLQVPDGASRILELIDRFLAIAALAPIVIPLTELRKLVGGLPNLQLPNGRIVRAGRWVSWAVSGALVLLSHWLGWLDSFTTADNLQAWWALEWATLGLIANYVYDRFFAEPEIIDVGGSEPSPA